MVVPGQHLVRFFQLKCIHLIILMNKKKKKILSFKESIFEHKTQDI